MRMYVFLAKSSCQTGHRSCKAYLEITYQLNFLLHLCNDTFVMVSCVLVDSGDINSFLSGFLQFYLLTLHEFLFARVDFFCKGPHVLREYIICQLHLFLEIAIDCDVCDVLYYSNKHSLLINMSWFFHDVCQN